MLHETSIMGGAPNENMPLTAQSYPTKPSSAVPRSMRPLYLPWLILSSTSVHHVRQCPNGKDGGKSMKSSFKLTHFQNHAGDLDLLNDFCSIGKKGGKSGCRGMDLLHVLSRECSALLPITRTALPPAALLSWSWAAPL